MPSPDYPSEIQSVGNLVTDETSEYYGKYDVPVVTKGKNLLDYTKATASSGGNISFFENGFTFTGKFYVSFNCDNIVVGNVYVMSWNYQSNDVLTPKWRLSYTDGTFSHTLSNGGAITIDKKVKNILIYPEMTSTIHTTTFTNIQLEKGSSATEYEPYTSVTKHIYLNEPLRKVGDYADYIDFKNQRVVRNIIKQSLNINNIYKKLNSVIRFGSTPGIDIKHKRDSHILSPIFHFAFDYILGWTANIECIFHHPYVDYTLYWSVYWSRLGLAYDGTNVYRIGDTEQTPLADREIRKIAREWLSTLSDEDKEIYVILNTPTEEPITVPELTTPNSAVMNVSSETATQPSQIDFTYYQDINKVITNLTNAVLAQGGNV